MDNKDAIFSQVNDLLKQVLDPEIGINIVDLGLVYEISLSDENEIKVVMTLTTPGCPMGQSITATVTNLLTRHLPGYTVNIELVWFPQWDAGMISEAGQAQLNGNAQQDESEEEPKSFWSRLF